MKSKQSIMSHPGVIQFKKKYKDINDTLYWIVEQAKASYPYAVENFNQQTPEQLFKTFRLITQYKSDPKDRELIQSLPTMLEDNWHGISGAGDCDCFVTGLIAMLWATGVYDIDIVLAGRNRRVPKHIYLYIYDNAGNRYVMDATEPFFNSERYYPFTQALPVPYPV